MPLAAATGFAAGVALAGAAGRLRLPATCGATKPLHVLRQLLWYRVWGLTWPLIKAHHLEFTGLVLVLALAAARRRRRAWVWWVRQRVLPALSTARCGGSTLLQQASHPALWSRTTSWLNAAAIGLAMLVLCVSPHQHGPTVPLFAVSAGMATCFLPHPTALAGPDAAKPAAVWEGTWLWLWLWLLLWVQVWVPAWPPGPRGLPAGTRLAAAAAAAACLAATCCHVAWHGAAWRRRRKAKSMAACEWVHEQQPKQQKQQEQEQEEEEEDEQQSPQQRQLVQVQQLPPPLPVLDAVSYQSRAGCRCLAVKVHSHPGTHEEYAPRVAAAAPGVLRAAAQARQEARAARQQEQPQPQNRPALLSSRSPQIATATGPAAARRPTGAAADPSPTTSSSGQCTPRLQPPTAPEDSPARPQARGPTADPPALHGAAVLRGCTQLMLWSAFVRQGPPQRPAAEPPTPAAPTEPTGGAAGYHERLEPAGPAAGSGQHPAVGPGLIPSPGLGGGGGDLQGGDGGQEDSRGGLEDSRGGQEDSEGDDWCGEAAACDLVARVMGALPDQDQLAGVWVQVAGGRRAVVLQAECRGDPQAAGPPGRLGQPCAPSSAVRLVRLYPPALELMRGRSGSEEEAAPATTTGSSECAGVECGLAPAGALGEGDVEVHGAGEELEAADPSCLRLLLHSPVAQAVKLVVLRPSEEDGGTAAAAEGGGEGEVGLSVSCLAAEFPLQLAEGVQEVRVDLGGVVREVAGCGAQVLQLMLLPLSRSVRDDRAPQQLQATEGVAAAGTASPPAPAATMTPLMHFTVPLLLLPAAAAADLRLLDQRMQWEAGEGAAAAAAAGTEPAAAAAQPPDPELTDSSARPGSTDQHAYWCAYMGPLLHDIALALRAAAACADSGVASGPEAPHGGGGGGGGGGGQGAAVLEAVLAGLLPFLQTQRMDATAALLLPEAPDDRHVTGSDEAGASAAAAPADAAGAADTGTEGPGFPPVPATTSTIAPGQAPTLPAPSASALAAPSASAPSASAPTPPAPSASAPSSPSASTPSASAPTPPIPSASAYTPSASAPSSPSAPTLLHLLHGFPTSGLEHRYRTWRAARVAKAVLPLMLLAAVPHLAALGASVWGLLASHLQLKQLTPLARWAQALCALALHATSWAGDVGGHLAGLALVPAAGRGGGRRGGLPAEAPSVGAGNLTAVRRRGTGPVAAGALLGRGLQEPSVSGFCAIGPASLDGAYALGAVVLGPLLLLFIASAAVLLHSGVPRLADAGVPSAGLVAAVTRAVTGPCVQQLAARQVVWASPVLVLGEVLLLGVLEPEWSSAHVWGMAAGWRLVALVLAAGFEWRARRRFLLGLAAEGEVRERGEVGVAGWHSLRDFAAGRRLGRKVKVC